MYEEYKNLDKEFWDEVYCCNCNTYATVPPGEEQCPQCKMKGALAWADEQKR